MGEERAGHDRSLARDEDAAVEGARHEAHAHGEVEVLREPEHEGREHLLQRSTKWALGSTPVLLKHPTF